MAKVRIQDNSRAVLARIERNINDLLTVSSIIVKDDAKQNTPVDQGTLRSSINQEVKGNKAFIGSDGLRYAARIELGFSGVDILGRTFNQRGYYMLTNALRNNSKAILKLFKDKLLK